MVPKLTPEMRTALREHSGRPVKVEDEQSRKMYLLVEEDTVGQLFEHWLARELQVGIDQAERGEVVDWDEERVKSEGRRRLRERSSEA